MAREATITILLRKLFKDAKRTVDALLNARKDGEG